MKFKIFDAYEYTYFSMHDFTSATNVPDNCIQMPCNNSENTHVDTLVSFCRQQNEQKIMVS